MSGDLDLEIDREAVRRARPGKRLWQYALIYKKTILLALLMLAIAIGTELTGPFIAKRIIDVHIAGIEKPWYEVEAGSVDSVAYAGAYWMRVDRVPVNEQKKEARVLQVGRDFFFVPGGIKEDGERSISLTADGATELIITKKDTVTKYNAQHLSKEQLYEFYKPELGAIISLALLSMALIAVSALFSYGQRYWLQASANRIIQRMRDDVFAHINRLPIRYFDNLPAGKVVSRITNDTEAIKELYVTVLANFFSGTLYIVAILGAMFLLDVRLALICMLIIPILAVWIIIYRKFAAYYNRVIRSTLSEMNGMINESIQGMPIIQSFRREKKQEHEFEQFNKRYFDYRNKMLNLNSLTSHNLVGVLRNIAFIAMIWYFSGISLGSVVGGVSLGVLYAFVDFLNRMFQPIVNIVNQLPNMEQAFVSAERVFVLMDEEGEDVSDEKMARYKGNVVFDKVGFSYKEGEPVLKGISFEARQGQTVALVGHTGSGKSSILNLIFRFYDVDSGSITIDGQEIRGIPRQTLRNHMGIVLQDPFLFTGTIASNVSLNHSAISRDTIEKALRDVGADRALSHLPLGIDEPVIEKGSTLSAGQRQLISFARALAFDPAILILDEATSNIDTETEAVIQEALDIVKKGRTTFVIAHRLSTIKSADLILVLDRGEIVERGTHDELMVLGGKYYQMYELQQGKKGARISSTTSNVGTTAAAL
ncbi:ATP-binding cassette domain-containing protein [Paenibacillus sp. LMG 31456]|uniref:ATP-binding cassette domain-containing protein n=1 Tax=Paenibacillus foliorum TaxID=2654974 RepID=A0A972K4N3_9BACL|nr:ABC transporter ATP-binding protein [Paenibacillus foliorum]NOU97133.1 ATP-binding cassette domain-containing protein [Paenibacillus foliorum]